MLKIKFVSLFLVLAFVFLFSIDAAAGSFSKSLPSASHEPSVLEGVEITVGLLKDSEVTFDEKRNVVGSAPKDASVSIVVYVPDESSEDSLGESNWTEAFSYQVVIGSSGVFTQTVDLALGENKIVITAEKDEAVFNRTITIKRKAAEIKRQLEKGIHITKVS